MRVSGADHRHLWHACRTGLSGHLHRCWPASERFAVAKRSGGCGVLFGAAASTNCNLLYTKTLMNTDFNGIVLIDKPAGISSFGVVGRVRWLLSQTAGKKIKVGHTGTLDPFATGLLILVVGKATKRAGEFSKLDKIYQATVKLGDTSSTGDPEGEITAVSNTAPDQKAVLGALKGLTGQTLQTPPQFSAIKINGQRAYKLARAGKEVDIPARKVTIYSLDLLDYSYPYLKIRSHVSSGTYIRSLAVDIGQSLGTGAYLTDLRRTKVGQWSVDQAQPLSESVTITPESLPE